MVEAISDCQMLISGGMGSPAYNRAIATGLDVVLTANSSIALSIEGYLAGTLANDSLLLHVH